MTNVVCLHQKLAQQQSRLLGIQRAVGIEAAQRAFAEAVYLVMGDHHRDEPTVEELDLATAIVKNSFSDAVRYLNEDIPTLGRLEDVPAEPSHIVEAAVAR